MANGRNKNKKKNKGQPGKSAEEAPAMTNSSKSDDESARSASASSRSSGETKQAKENLLEPAAPRRPTALRMEEHVVRELRETRSALEQARGRQKELQERLKALQAEHQQFMTPRTQRKEKAKLKKEEANSRSGGVPLRKKTCCCRCLTWCCWLSAAMFVVLLATWGSVTVWDQDYEVAQKVLDRVSDGLGVGLNETFGVKTMPRPGQTLAAEGRRKRFPVVFIPGVISSGLEVWKAKPCAESMFRQRLWGTASMMQKLAFDPNCWIEHIKLNQSGGSWRDPDGIKLRAASGLGAADYFITGYNLWGKLIHNLADVGYDEDSMHLAAYDWRLPYSELELRDRYFTKLRRTIELLKDANDQQKVVVIGHSMGATVWLHFMQWVSQSQFGGSDWVAQHIATFVALAGSLLGAPKALAAAVSGEAADTVGLDSLSRYVKDKFLPPQAAIDIFRSTGSIASLFPKGGSLVWNADTLHREGRRKMRNASAMMFEAHNGSNHTAPGDGGGDDDDDDDARGEATKLVPVAGGMFLTLLRNESAREALLDIDNVRALLELARNTTSFSQSEDIDALVTAIDSESSAVQSPDSCVPEEYTNRNLTSNSELLATALAMIAASGLDANADGSVDEAEFHNWQGLFRLLDVDASGNISGPELLELAVLGLGAAAPVLLLNETNFNFERTTDALLRAIAPAYADLVSRHYSFGVSEHPEPAGFPDHRAWSNPLETQLPYAPDMSVVCMYGVGLNTERAYAYRQSNDVEVERQQRVLEEALIDAKTSGRAPPPVQPILIDESRNDDVFNFGIEFSDGDGTIPLLSLGFMCERGWPLSRAHNPGVPASQFVVREYAHDRNRNINIRDITWVAQGGTATADHISILGNNELLEDIVRMVTAPSAPPLNASNVESTTGTDDFHGISDRDLRQKGSSSKFEGQSQWLPERRVLSELTAISDEVEWPPPVRPLCVDKVSTEGNDCVERAGQ